MTLDPKHLGRNHRDTLAQIFRHPLSHNIEWQAAVSLLREVGDVTERHDGKLEVIVGGETIVLTRPRGKDLDAQQVIDIRELLETAGYGPSGKD
ncbi:MAG: hypothetical protein ABSA65_15505 [Acidimicrobiales bacterium]|jgi:hypothetical protein